MNSIKNTVKNIFKNHKKYLVIGAVIVFGVIYFAFGKGSAQTALYTVEKANIEQSVALSGKVQTSDKADLGFAASGRVARVFVKNNQQVSEGQTLAQLEIGDLLADLQIKQLNSNTSDIDLTKAKQELEKVTTEEDTKVENAYRMLLTDGLKLIPDSADYRVEPPSIGGKYDGPEGEYKINIDRDAATDPEIFTFGLERTRRIVNEQGPTELGTRGLYISFPADDIFSYRDTIWHLNIPNKASSSYGTNLSAYNSAKAARDLAIKNVQAEYEKLVAENGGGDSVAAAEIQKINSEIRKNTIYAPFKGKVTNIEKEVGENASVGERVISILGEDKLEVVLQVSELDVSRIPQNAPMSITLDAFPDETFAGTLETINSRETTVEGVPVYEAFVELAPDSRIKTGMSAKGDILLASKSGVLAVPLYVVEKSGDKSIVQVMTSNNKIEKREVVLGLIGTDSMAEVISGLSEGDQVVSKPAK